MIPFPLLSLVGCLLLEEAPPTPEPACEDPTPWALDLDGDGYGDPNFTLMGCEAPSGYVVDATDCDDARAEVHPGAQETCDASDLDEDCDGRVDEDDPTVSGAVTVCADLDEDTYGAEPCALTCDPPSGAPTEALDCDDQRADVHPGALEVCLPADVDEDCDGLIDAADADAALSLWYRDADGDSYGDASLSVEACVPPDGYVASALDCDDTDPDVNPAGADPGEIGWSPTELLATSVEIGVTLTLELRETDPGQLEVRVCDLMSPFYNDVYVMIDEWEVLGGAELFGSAVATEGQECSPWEGLEREEEFVPGDVLGLTGAVISPYYCVVHWEPFCLAEDVGCGSCWAFDFEPLTLGCR